MKTRFKTKEYRNENCLDFELIHEHIDKFTVLRLDILEFHEKSNRTK